MRKLFRPYGSLRELAEAADITVPQLKKRLRNLDKVGKLSLEAVLGEKPPQSQLFNDQTFKLFHDNERCLVCGSEMTPPKRRDIGWGEFMQCSNCGFSAHEMASYSTRRKAASDLLREMLRQSEKTDRVLTARTENQSRLRN